MSATAPRVAYAAASAVVAAALRHSTPWLLSTIATLGTAEDITLRKFRTEAFYPADVEAARWGRGVLTSG